ncbi:Alpha/Beta hydrolase protein [Pseudomassariella vexata]|uniref:Alpha/Beta hydrolase protein n=1 Tax=Pseudomassariella vexata TaxID=1141098 RepID=A0A1Y2EDB1_9PEZI|nr:Alpha/Beta hydrolase protein [Pseudomassariella vexata]ORY69550.1 Alpha/Beta hydrolase protein [Pseudomassariella vexata]
MMSEAPFKAIYKVVDGLEIDTDVYLPSGSGGSTGVPVVINIHGGVFMLGSSSMVNNDQINDCLSRGWIVVVPNHRLCPQVNLLEGPMQDSRDLLAWIYDGGLQRVIGEQSKPHQVDLDHVFAFGTSSGGHLALSLGFDVPRPVAAIYDMYGCCNFASPFWSSKIPAVLAKLPPNLSQDFINQVYTESPIPTHDGVSLEGQAPGPPDFSRFRPAFVFTQIGNGTVMDAIFPSKDWDKVDPIRNISPEFPPTFIVHGMSDTMVPIGLSRDFLAELRKHGVLCGMREIPGEEHTFAARMKVGSQTWEMQKEGFDFLQKVLEDK